MQQLQHQYRLMQQHQQQMLSQRQIVTSSPRPVPTTVVTAYNGSSHQYSSQIVHPSRTSPPGM